MSETATAPEEKTCKPIRITTGCKVVVEPGSNAIWGLNRMRPEEQQAALEKWAKELREFFRDHRSMDVNHVGVDVETEQVCSECKRAWEPVTEEEDGGPLMCANCGTRLATA